MPVGVLNFDFGERVEILASAVFIFGQSGLEQTPDAKSVARMQRGVTVRTLVRLERNRRKRTSEAVEIHLGEVKFTRARGRESLSQALLRKPEGEVPKIVVRRIFDQPLREFQISETASVFAVYPIELHFQCSIAAANIVRDAPVEKRKDGELLPGNREFSSEIKLPRPFTCLHG